MATLKRTTDQISFLKENDWEILGINQVARQAAKVYSSDDWRNIPFESGMFVGDTCYQLRPEKTKVATISQNPSTVQIANPTAINITYMPLDESFVYDGTYGLGRNDDIETGFTHSSNATYTATISGGAGESIKFNLFVPNLTQSFRFVVDKNYTPAIIQFYPEIIELLTVSSSTTDYNVRVLNRNCFNLGDAYWYEYQQLLTQYWIQDFSSAILEAQIPITMLFTLNVETTFSTQFRTFFQTTLAQECYNNSHGLFNITPNLLLANPTNTMSEESTQS